MGDQRHRQHDPEQHDANRHAQQRPRCATLEKRDLLGPDHVHDQRLRQQSLDEPGRLEQGLVLRRVGAEDVPHQRKRRDVKDRADRAKIHHEAAGVGRIPALRLLQEFIIDVVERDRNLRHVVQQVLHQQMQRQHRQEGQKRTRDQHRKYIAEIRAGRHLDVLEHVGERAAPFQHTLFQHHQTLFEQDQVSRLLCDINCGVDRDPDVGRAQGRCIIDAVAHEADHMAIVVQHAHDALLMHRAQLGKPGGHIIRVITRMGGPR